MSSSASPAPSRRKTLLSLGVLALLTGIVVFIFREHWAEISEALSRLTLGQELLALAVGLSYPEKLAAMRPACRELYESYYSKQAFSDSLQQAVKELIGE